MRSTFTRSTLLKISVVIVFGAAAVCFTLLGESQRTSASAFGPSASHTDAPGEDNCTSCHSSFPVNSGTGGVTITGLPHDYLPGQQIPVTIKTSQEGATIYGFQMTAIDRLGGQVGTFSLPVQAPARMQVINGLVGGNVRQYVEHTVDGLAGGVFGSNTWTFTWTAPAQRVGKVRFYAAGNAANSDGGTGDDYIYTKAAATLSGSAISNFDGDFFSDIAVFRPSTGVWYSFSINNNTFKQSLFGLIGDIIAPGDYDGDGTTDLAVFRPSSGVWYIQQSTLGFMGVPFGSNGDIPAQGDYDGDGKTDIALFRPSTGIWYLLQSTAGFRSELFGVTGDKPAQGDYDGDGKTDVAVYRPSNGVWYRHQSLAGFTSSLFGVSEDHPVQADYDGDGKTDLGVFRPSTGTWYFANSTGTYTGAAFGFGTDIPAPADYDSDGKADIAVFRPSTGVWYLFRSADNSYYAATFGLNSDVPVPAGYIAQ